MSKEHAAIPLKLQSAADKGAIESRIRSYIIDNFLLGVGDHLEDSTQLMEAGILDSTGVMELVTFIETSFGIVISEEEIIPENLNSLDSISTFVVRKSD
jgi:acyl carrier protein